MSNGNDTESKNLLKKAYNCRKDEFESLLQKIDSELEKNNKNPDVLTAKLVITSKMAVKN